MGSNGKMRILGCISRIRACATMPVTNADEETASICLENSTNGRRNIEFCSSSQRKVVMCKLMCKSVSCNTLFYTKHGGGSSINSPVKTSVMHQVLYSISPWPFLRAVREAPIRALKGIHSNRSHELPPTKWGGIMVSIAMSEIRYPIKTCLL